MEYSKCHRESMEILDKLPEVVLHNCPTVMTYDDLISSENYREMKNMYSLSHHNGQLKLFLSEIQFLTEMCSNLDEEVYVIYAGSAPGNKNVYLSQLFPTARFIFIDPAEHFFKMGDKNQYNDEKIMDEILYFSTSKFRTKFDFKNKISKPHNINLYTENQQILKVSRYDSKGGIPPNIGEVILANSGLFNIFVIEDFFTSELAKQFYYLKRKGKKVLFISDIRTVSGIITEGDEESGPKDIDILWNSAQMYNWIMQLKPNAYMLKFRCPFSYDLNIDLNTTLTSQMTKDFRECTSIDFIENYRNRKFIFIKGDAINLQAYPGKSSTETRLIGRAKYDSLGKYILDHRDYNIKEYEDKLFYYNRFLRIYGWHSIPDEFLNKFYMVDRCGDCAIMSRILLAYIRKFKNYEEESTIVGFAFSILTTVLRHLDRYQLSKKDDIHGYYYDEYFDVNSLKKYNEILCSKKNNESRLHLAEYKLFYNPNNDIWDKFAVRYYNKINSLLNNTAEKRLYARGVCMDNVLFDIPDQLSSLSMVYEYKERPSQIIVTDREGTNRTVTKFHKIKDECLDVTPKFRDLVFSRQFYDLPSIKITDPYFYEILLNKLKSSGVTRLHVLLSNRIDILFKKSFYEDNKGLITVYTLIEDGVERLARAEMLPTDIIVVYIDELDHVKTFVRNYLIKKHIFRTIIFLSPSKDRIYSNNYIFTKEAYIHVEIYNNGYNRINAKDISTDSYNIDKDIGYWIKDLPYVFMIDGKKNELQYDISERYRIYNRIYLLPYHVENVFLENNEIYYIEKLNRDGCFIVRNYFLFLMGDYSVDYFYISNIKINGEYIDKIPIRNLGEMEKYKGFQTIRQLYDNGIIRSPPKKIDSIQSILDNIYGFP